MLGAISDGVPRPARPVSPDGYDVVLVNALHCPDAQFQRLTDWARSGKVLLMYTDRAFALDELRTDKREQRANVLAGLASAKRIPADLAEFRGLIESRLHVKPFTPDGVFPNIDIDAQTSQKGERLFVLANYGTDDQDISFSFDAPWARHQQVFSNAELAVSREGEVTHVRARLPRQDAEVVVFRKP